MIEEVEHLPRLCFVMKSIKEIGMRPLIIYEMLGLIFSSNDQVCSWQKRVKCVDILSIQYIWDIMDILDILDILYILDIADILDITYILDILDISFLVFHFI